MSALAGLLLVLVLPSLAGAVLLSGSRRDAAGVPGDVVPDLALSRGLACGIATWLLGSGLLTRTVGLTATSVWVWDAVIGAASLVFLLLPHHRARLRAVLGPMGRRLAEVCGLTALVYLPLGYAIVRISWSPLGSTPWYYYGLARQVADLGSIPVTSIEFGTTTPFLNDYHLFTTGTAMLLLQHPGGPIAVITTVNLIGVLLLGLGTVALTTALGAGRGAALLAVPVAVAAGVAPLRLASYRPEGFALGVALLLVALGIDWLHSRNRGSLVGAALLAATLSQVHGIAALTSGVMVAAAALVSLARGPRAEQLRRTAIGLVVLLAAVVVTGLVFREASGTVHAGGLVDRGGLADPTWEFFRAARDETTSMPPSNSALVEQSVRELYDWQRWWFVPALLLAIVGLWRRRRDAAARQVVSFTLLSLLGMIAVASVFMFGWQGYVPRRTGASRIVLEASLLGPPLVAIGLECLVRDAQTWRRRRLVPEPRLAGLVLLAALSVGGAISLIRVADYDDGQAPSRQELALWRSLPMTSRDVVLANGYTEGFIPDVTGARGLLDGRAPYTFDAQLRRANGLLRGGQAFFSDPARHWDFLASNDVSWVVVGSHHALGTGNVWDTPPPDLRALESCPGLDRYAQDETLTVFRVVDDGPQGCRPR
jgi:Family of unknown function (DUF6541)